MIQYLEKWQSDNEVWSANEYNLKKFFLKNHTQNMLEKLVPDPFQKS